ncbi:hypothetical protein Syun_007300 [Stephania yunnanensis]|uniref:Uncharacterized protein n=1 Tax=Stephania yunnanensis TaxID=152371 RepID=A0AAP0Q061_9MAGN
MLVRPHSYLVDRVGACRPPLPTAVDLLVSRSAVAPSLVGSPLSPTNSLFILCWSRAARPASAPVDPLSRHTACVASWPVSPSPSPRAAACKMDLRRARSPSLEPLTTSTLLVGPRRLRFTGILPYLPPLFNLPKSQLQCYGESVYCTSVGEDVLSKCNKGETQIERLLAVVTC